MTNMKDELENAKLLKAGTGEGYLYQSEGARQAALRAAIGNYNERKAELYDAEKLYRERFTIWQQLVKECQMVNALMSEMVFEGVGSAVLRNVILRLHKAFGHCSWRRLKMMIDKGLINLGKLKPRKIDWRELPAMCDACAQAKMTGTRKPKLSMKRSTRLFEQLHIDIADCIHSIGGFRYCAIIVDDFSNYTWALFLKRKKHAASQVNQFIRSIITGKSKEIRTDGAGSLTGGEFSRMCAKYGTTKMTTVPYSSHQNGRAEKAIRDVFDSIHDGQGNEN